MSIILIASFSIHEYFHTSGGKADMMIVYPQKRVLFIVVRGPPKLLSSKKTVRPTK